MKNERSKILRCLSADCYISKSEGEFPVVNCLCIGEINGRVKEGKLEWQTQAQHGPRTF